MNSKALSAAVVTLGCLALASTSQPARAQESDFKFGVGALGVLGGVFLDEPSNNVLTLPNGQQAPTEIYPGFGGVAMGGGLMVDARYADLIGIEIDLIRSSDHGKGTYTVNGIDFDIEIGQSAWHLPVLLKLSAPLEVVRPFLLVGPEFVFPGDASATVTNSQLLQTTMSAKADTYVLLTAGLGVEIVLPIPDIDIRIPISMRGSINTSVGDNLDDRVEATIVNVASAAGSFYGIQHIEYDSAWKYQAQATLGVAYYF